MTPWWRGAVLYQIYPRSFRDTDGDGVGDLPGVIEKLDYVAALGVDGIWLSPFFPSPMVDFGYDVADYRGVDPRFGTLADLDRLLARAHALGLKVIIDQVYSHSSDRHPWFAESRTSRDTPKAGWYVWADPRPDGTPPNNWLSLFGGPAWEWDARRRQYYLHNFHRAQPDLNFHEPAVQEAICEVARFWLDRGVDGFRLDVANFYFHDAALRDNPPTGRIDAWSPYDFQRHLHDRSRPETLGFVARLRRLLDSYPERMAVAEIASASPLERMIEYTDGPDRVHTAYCFILLNGPFDAAFIRGAVERQRQLGPDAWPSWSFGNHDFPRVVTRWGGERDPAGFARLTMALLLALRGTIFVYQGEELGLPDGAVPYERMLDPEGLAFWPDRKSRDDCRTPMPWQAAAPFAGFAPPGAAEPWLPVQEPHRRRAVDRQLADPASPLMTARRLLRFRRGRPALRHGDIRFLSVPPPLLVLERWHGDDRLLCAFNLSERPQRAALATELTERLLPDLGGGRLGGGTLELPPYGFLFAGTE